MKFFLTFQSLPAVGLEADGRSRSRSRIKPAGGRLQGAGRGVSVCTTVIFFPRLFVFDLTLLSDLYWPLTLKTRIEMEFYFHFDSGFFYGIFLRYSYGPSSSNSDSKIFLDRYTHFWYNSSFSVLFIAFPKTKQGDDNIAMLHISPCSADFIVVRQPRAYSSRISLGFYRCPPTSDPYALHDYRI